MAKMRIYKFWNESGTEKEKESMSLKKVNHVGARGFQR